MNLGQHLVEALSSLTSNKLRSALTILGIVIGVGAVISMLAIGRGAQTSINSSIESIGTNLLFVNSGGNGVTNPRPLTMEDAAALASKTNAPAVARAVPVLQGRGSLAYAGQTGNSTVVASTAEYAALRSLKTSEGSLITATQVNNRSAVAVIGSEVATNLFGRTTGVTGNTIRINGQSFRVIGVLESKGGGALGSQDNQVLIPITTGQSRLFNRSPRDRVDSIMVQATDSSTVTQAVEQVTSILRARHQTRDKDDFSILNQADILSTATSITGVLTLFLGGIAAISLLVGGIGIMNIMLVSVTERTREIGLRKALGARRSDILIQFLAESLALSLTGGVLGILLAAGISVLIGQIAASSGTQITPVIGADAVALATLFSLAVGLFFGLYPANRAAGLAPVEALRYE